ncbi:hypothetical protein [Candidatus Entotheonella palauensis]|uniref:Uncharacterized protein n=1 Tax=Candidatus Entotheonella gemina TaxID=1429439 RepID=W4M2M4_9BACT|nr:hypothetical protein [Candidatus Entotheonella palauensis]ETX04413.1 MAG: hypothetical protein ETSY2_28925 [Candidatus Entotheonella gemina]
MAEASIEERLAAVEIAVKDLRSRLVNVPSSPNWLEQITGSFKNKPAFEDVLKYGREWRQADQLPEEPEASA